MHKSLACSIPSNIHIGCTRLCTELGVRSLLLFKFQRHNLINVSQLTASDINFAIVRPLVFKYAKLDNLAVVYACFVVRSHFLSEAEENMAYTGILSSRAMLCEILAMKLLGRFASSEMQLAVVLTASWNPLAGSPHHIANEIRAAIGGHEVDPQSALEVYTTVAPSSKSSLTYTLDGHCHRVKALYLFSPGPGYRQPYIQRPRGILNHIQPFGTCGQL